MNLSSSYLANRCRRKRQRRYWPHNVGSPIGSTRPSHRACNWSVGHCSPCSSNRASFRHFVGKSNLLSCLAQRAGRTPRTFGKSQHSVPRGCARGGSLWGVLAWPAEHDYHRIYHPSSASICSQCPCCCSNSRPCLDKLNRPWHDRARSPPKRAAIAIISPRI